MIGGGVEVQGRGRIAAAGAMTAVAEGETEIDAIDVIIATETDIMVDRHMAVDHEEEDVTTTDMVLLLPASSADHLA